LFYMANMCNPRLRHKKRVYEMAVTKTIPCLPGETLSIPPWPWPLGKPLPVLHTTNGTQLSTCANHTLECRLLQTMGRDETTKLMMPDYYFLGNATTIRNMFYSIVEDWHEGQFRKSAGHCNHGLLGGRLTHKVGVVRVGRYKYHKVDLEIPRMASWFPAPSLHEYLGKRGALWASGRSPDEEDDVLVKQESLWSRCRKVACSIPGSESFQG
jgi:hypothetical protein